jgi:hypothetical protein
VKERYTHTQSVRANVKLDPVRACVVKGFVVERERECFVLFCFFLVFRVFRGTLYLSLSLLQMVFFLHFGTLK